MPPWFLKFEPTTRSKLKYGIGIPLPSSNCKESNLSLVGSLITTLLVMSDCGRLLRFGIATARSRARQRISCASLGCSSLPEGRSRFEKRGAPSSDASVPWNYGDTHSNETLRLRGQVRCHHNSQA